MPDNCMLIFSLGVVRKAVVQCACYLLKGHNNYRRKHRLRCRDIEQAEDILANKLRTEPQ